MDQELSRFKQILEAKQAELELLVWAREGIYIERSADALDEIQHAALRELAIHNLDRETLLLRAVRAALRRLQDGTYGVCQGCGEQISPRRLAAVAWTPYCLHCQELMDRREEQVLSQYAA